MIDTDVVKKYRRWLVVGTVVAFAAGFLLGTQAFRPDLGSFRLVINWCLLLSVVAINGWLLVVLWDIRWGPAVLLLLVANFFYWPAHCLGFVFGYGDGEAEIVVAAVTCNLLSTVASSVLLWRRARPRNQMASDGLLAACFSFRLRHLLIATAIVAALFAAARIPRGVTTESWEVVYEAPTSGPDTTKAIARATASIDKLLASERYIDKSTLDKTFANHHFYGRGGSNGAEIVWYRRESPGDEQVFIRVKSDGDWFAVDTFALVPKTLLPTDSAVKQEGENIAAAIERWWEEYHQTMVE